MSLHKNFVAAEIVKYLTRLISVIASAWEVICTCISQQNILFLSQKRVADDIVRRLQVMSQNWTNGKLSQGVKSRMIKLAQGNEK